ncbi:hypothetical protein [Haloglomus litoreum]|uniref:hypothetical protein n=1 Tax=Haloglomus litoreum TaxID=3034026 RepID=UPI0023E7CE7B|nr:hypothetical protein [Haloglomus sp. DT116]
MGRALDAFIVVVTMAVALFGLGAGSYIYTTLPANTLGPLLVGLSLTGGVFGIAKWFRMRRRTDGRSTRNDVRGPQF